MYQAAPLQANSLGQTLYGKKTIPSFSSKDFTSEPDEAFSKKTFIAEWDNRPVEDEPVVLLNNISIVTPGNTSSIIASPGIGKSSLMDAIAANFLNPDCDSLGFSVFPGCVGVIGIDFERTDLDVWNSFYRRNKRAGISQGAEINNVMLAGMRAIPRLEERKAAILTLLDHNPCSLLLLDGAGDLVTDTNDLPQAIECRIFLRELCVKYRLSIITTIHPNPGTSKPRGHIGSEITRESECVLLAKKIQGDYRLITTDFEHGKNRNNSDINAGYKWCDENKMFVTADLGAIAENQKSNKDAAKRQDAETIASAVLAPPNALKNVELVYAIMQNQTKSESTAKRLLGEMVGWGIIKKSDDGYYRSNI